MINLSRIAFEITDHCNLDCVYCYNIWKMNGATHKPFNSYKKATATLQQLFKQADIKSVALTGGEPFLAERFLEIVLFCRMEGKQLTLISNGTQGKPSEYKQLLKMGVALFELPIHSAQAAVHDRMTQRNGSWQKAEEEAGLWEKSVPAFCSSCAEWEKCKGGCRAASEQCFGSLGVEDPILIIR